MATFRATFKKRPNKRGMSKEEREKSVKDIAERALHILEENFGKKEAKTKLAELREMMKGFAEEHNMVESPETMYAFAVGMGFHDLMVDTLGANKAIMMIGLAFALSADMNGTLGTDHKHGNDEPTFRKRADGTHFCAECDEDVSNEVVEGTKKKN